MSYESFPAIANCFQHAQAERCETEINYDSNQLRIGIRDNGCGVEGTILEAGDRSGGWDLPGMYERAGKSAPILKFGAAPGQARK